MDRAQIFDAILRECRLFCKKMGRVGMEPELTRMALRSYYAMPKDKRLKWTLEQVVNQGL